MLGRSWLLLPGRKVEEVGKWAPLEPAVRDLFDPSPLCTLSAVPDVTRLSALDAGGLAERDRPAIQSGVFVGCVVVGLGGPDPHASFALMLWKFLEVPTLANFPRDLVDWRRLHYQVLAHHASCVSLGT